MARSDRLRTGAELGHTRSKRTEAVAALPRYALLSPPDFYNLEYAAVCILTVNERLLSAISGRWLTVNVTPKPPHLGASRAYLEDVTAAEFCEEGRHGLVLEYELVTQLLELGLIQDGVLPDVGSNAEQREICRRSVINVCAQRFQSPRFIA